MLPKRPCKCSARDNPAGIFDIRSFLGGNKEKSCFNLAKQWSEHFSKIWHAFHDSAETFQAYVSPVPSLILLDLIYLNRLERVSAIDSGFPMEKDYNTVDTFRRTTFLYL